MDTKIVILFIVLTFVNVIIQTVKSIATIQCGKTVASVVNALAYGLYTYVVFFTASEGMSLHAKALTTAIANFIGVYIVKLVEEKSRKDKLWKVEITIPEKVGMDVLNALNAKNISFNYSSTFGGKYFLFNCYCATQAESKAVAEIARTYNGKISAYESKNVY